jgi:hypothetical protein
VSGLRQEWLFGGLALFSRDVLRRAFRDYLT